MTNNSSLVDSTFDLNSQSLGAVLDLLSAEGQKKNPAPLPLERLLQDIPDVAERQNESMLIGALTVLHSIGLISVDERGRVKISNRYAGFAVASLSEFIKSNVPAVKDPVDENEKRYLVDLTKSLESAREQKVGEGQNISNAPLHSRRIVNVLIKSRQIRQWKMQDVFLHVYHNQWKQYHLVGWSKKNPEEVDEDIAKKALAQQVGLTTTQYDIDEVFNPAPIKLVLISATSGALTEYTYRLIGLKKIKTRLDLKKLIKTVEEKDGGESSVKPKYPDTWFRWFTWEEIQRRRSFQDEPIMESTSHILERVHDSYLVNAPKADDIRKVKRIMTELGNRFTMSDVVVLLGMVAVILAFALLPQIVASLGNQIPALDNIAKISSIVGTIVAIATTVWKLLKQARS